MTARHPRLALALSAVTAVILALLHPAAGHPVGAAPLQDGPENSDRPGSNHRIEFAAPGGEPLLLDIYYPALDGTPRPGIVLVHGGGWRREGRGALAGLAARLRDTMGVVVATVDYRLDVVPSGFPAEVDDVDAALRWMRESAGGWDVDPERIALVGSSSGANLALVAGLRETGAERVAGIVSLSAPVDLVALHAVTDPELNQVEDYLGCAPTACPELYETASPLAYVSEDDPPVLVVNGRSEDQIPVDQANLLDAALREAGVESQLLIPESDRHGHGLSRLIAPELDSFLRQTLEIGATSGTTAPPASSDPSVPADSEPPKDRENPGDGDADGGDGADSGDSAAGAPGENGDAGGGGVPTAALVALAAVAGLAAGVVISRRGATHLPRARRRTARRRD